MIKKEPETVEDFIDVIKSRLDVKPEKNISEIDQQELVILIYFLSYH